MRIRRNSEFYSWLFGQMKSKLEKEDRHADVYFERLNHEYRLALDLDVIEEFELIKSITATLNGRYGFTGSGGSRTNCSLICYLMGLHQVDPVASQLIPEFFWFSLKPKHLSISMAMVLELDDVAIHGALKELFQDRFILKIDRKQVFSEQEAITLNLTDTSGASIELYIHPSEPELLNEISTTRKTMRAMTIYANYLNDRSPEENMESYYDGIQPIKVSNNWIEISSLPLSPNLKRLPKIIKAFENLGSEDEFQVAVSLAMTRRKSTRKYYRKKFTKALRGSLLKMLPGNDPVIKEILAPTKGMAVYFEQTVQLAAHFTSLTTTEFMKRYFGNGISFKNHPPSRLIDDIVMNGYPSDFAKSVHNLICQKFEEASCKKYMVAGIASDILMAMTYRELLPRDLLLFYANPFTHDPERGI